MAPEKVAVEGAERNNFQLNNNFFVKHKTGWDLPMGDILLLKDKMGAF